MKLLEVLCKATTKQVFQILDLYGFQTIEISGRKYAFRPGRTLNSPLMVCHADTVVDGGNGPHNYLRVGDEVNSIALDDRLGIAAMLHTIDSDSPLADCAMLVCDEEEVARSTAQIFQEDISPNWLVELDRRGTDVVCYDYETPLLRSLLFHVGFHVGNGSFSDICYLEYLGVVGFNVGVGYHSEHSTTCHANLNDTRVALAKLEKFYSLFGDVRLDHEPTYDDYQPSFKTKSLSQVDFDLAWDEYIQDFDDDRDSTRW